MQWSGQFGGRDCRLPSRRDSRRIRRSPTRAGRRPAPRARLSFWRSPSPQRRILAVVRDRLDAALPDGIDVIEVADLAAAPAPRLEASDWQVVLPGVAPEDAARAAEVFLAAAHAEVDRLTSNGVRRLDTRAGVVSLTVDRRATTDGQPECAILRMVVRHMTPAVRPEDILVAFRHMSALEPVVTTRGDAAGSGAAGHRRCCRSGGQRAWFRTSGLRAGCSWTGSAGRPCRGCDPAGSARSGSAPARQAGRCTGTGNGNVPGSGDRQYGECRSRQRVRTAPAWRGAARRGRLRPGA